ncbi:hypothetical protein H2204_008563 [Knufia peltigerae]|uniref:Major facilitator superfamily (MFS) profile domain-containing protein n=1 Tax=Knufia peltigerae TaxID=1002370 RepID=A0AA38XZK1_9EURO|nr:hypothetical protein H2204_008563 [Knufia peltigerae]
MASTDHGDLKDLPRATPEQLELQSSQKSGSQQGQLAGLSTIGAVKKTWSVKTIWLLWTSAVLVSFAISYDQQTFSTYQPYAASEFGHLGLLSSVAVVQNVVAVIQQPLAKLADVYGRLPLLCACVLLATLGEILLASAQNMQTFAGAQVFFTIGIVGLHLLLVILAGDSSDLRHRALMNVVPYAPGLVTAWTASSVTSAVLNDTTWRWGYGVFAIIIPVISIPLLGTLLYNQRKAAKSHNIETASGRRLQHHLHVLRQLDPIGLILFIAAMALILVPITLASSATNAWKSGHIIAMIVLGVCLLVAFICWECKWAQWPVIPVGILRERTVSFGVIACIFDYGSWYTTSAYLYTYLLVVRNLSVRAATNVSIIIPFCAVIGQLGAGVAAKYFGRYKWISIFGVGMKVLGLGLMLRYREESPLASLAVAQVLQGLGEGVFNTIITGMQASVTEKYVLPNRLVARLPTSLQAEIPQIYGSAVIAIKYPWGTAERTAINAAYDDTMRILIIVALVLASVELLTVSLLKDLDLRTVDKSRDYDGMVIGKTAQQTAQAKEADDEPMEMENTVQRVRG